MTTVWVAGLADAEVDDLAPLVEPLGAILIHVARPPGGGPPLGYGFVRFASPAEAATALAALQGAQLRGHALSAAWAKAPTTWGFVRDEDAGTWRPGRIDKAGRPTWP